MEDNNTSSSASGAPIKLEDPSVTLTIRLIMQGKVSERWLMYLKYNNNKIKILKYKWSDFKKYKFNMVHVSLL